MIGFAVTVLCWATIASVIYDYRPLIRKWLGL